MPTEPRGLLSGDGTFTFVFVHCVMCDRFISNEDTHHCELAPSYAHERASARAAKMTKLALARSGEGPTPGTRGVRS